MKKFSRFLMLALCCGLLLSSCGDSDTTAGTSGGGDETSTEPVVVKYWGGSPAGMDGIQENLIADQIEKDIGVRLSCYANRDDAALTAMFASGEIDQESKDAAMAALNAVYWKHKAENRERYTTKKNKGTKADEQT